MSALVSLWKELMDFHKSLDPYFARSPEGHVRFQEFISDHIKSDTSCVLVAEDESRTIAGYCLSTLAKTPEIIEKKDYGIIYDLYITGRCRRQGIGERLYREIEAWFAGQGIHRIEVRVAASNESSAAFWWKMDFSPYLTMEYKNI